MTSYFQDSSHDGCGYSQGFLCARASNDWRGCRRRQFLAIWVATSLATLEIRPAILHGDMLCCWS